MATKKMEASVDAVTELSQKFRDAIVAMKPNPTSLEVLLAASLIIKMTMPEY